jgi:DNA-binding transcriptional MocR family regulator
MVLPPAPQPGSTPALTSPIDWSLLSTQAVHQPNLINLGYGYPDPALLPTEAMARACDTALKRFGPTMLEYGANAGPAPLLSMLRSHLAALGEGDVAPDQIMITPGNSHALDMLTTLHTQPGDVVLVESPTYHLALRVLRDHPVELVAAPSDEDGIDVTQLIAHADQLRREGKRISALYCVPTFNNPMGVSLPAVRRKQLVDWAAHEHVLIFEDDVYRELAYDTPVPPSLWSIAPRQNNPVIRMGSFAKTLAPGLRLGFVTARADVISRMAECGLVDSAGGIAHFAACCVAGLFENGDYGPQVDRLRTAYRARRDALLSALRAHLPQACTWHKPDGGFFVWVRLPSGMDSATLLQASQSLGVAFQPGRKFFTQPKDGTGGHNTIRLAFTLYDEAHLTEAVQRLGAAMHAYPNNTSQT